MKLLIMKKEIDFDASEVLYNAPETPENFEKYWQVKSANWFCKDGWFEGINPENCAGMIVSKEDYFGDVMVSFTAKTVLPSDHDIDVMWNGSWDEEKDQRDVAYVAGLEGWWEGKVGFERSPEYVLNAGTPLFDFEPGKEYHMIAGSIQGHVFIFVDGKLILEITDPDPIDSSKYGKVGFEAYCSHIQVKNIEVRRIAWNPRELSYPSFL